MNKLYNFWLERSYGFYILLFHLAIVRPILYLSKLSEVENIHLYDLVPFTIIAVLTFILVGWKKWG